MYDFMTRTVIMTSFVLIIMLDIYGIAYWTTTFVKWVRGKIQKKKEAPASDANTQDAE